MITPDSFLEIAPSPAGRSPFAWCKQVFNADEKELMSNRFFKTLKQKFLAVTVDREIFWKIFPQTEKTKNHGYTFTSDEGLIADNIQARFEFRVNLDRLNQEILHMPKAYSEGFRHIVYRDLNELLEAYLELAKKRSHPHAASVGTQSIPAKC